MFWNYLYLIISTFLTNIFVIKKNVQKYWGLEGDNEETYPKKKKKTTSVKSK